MGHREGKDDKVNSGRLMKCLHYRRGFSEGRSAVGGVGLSRREF